MTDQIGNTDNFGELFFRALSVDGERKGMRLERIFWSLLKRASQEQAILLSDIARNARGNNLSSYMRTYAAVWADRELEKARTTASYAQAVRTITACPSPAFIISADRRLRASNPAFQRYVRRHIPTDEDDAASKNLRLQIDVTTSELIAQLKLERDSVINVGFTFGFNERRVRGRLNAVIASCWEEELVAAYVLE